MPDRIRITCRRLVPASAALLAAFVFSSTAWGATSVNVIGDSVIVSDPPLGRSTISVTRPDALTGKPVVIGTFSGFANGLLPLTVNTSTATPLNPNGDCWQSGALSQAVTPDIQPGDTVTLTPQAGLGASPLSVTVPAEGTSGARGPIPSCSSVAPFAENAVRAVPTSITGGPIELSGVAQPLATGVSTLVSDGSRSTKPVDVAPAADGTWTTTIPAAEVDALAVGDLSVKPVFAVPDVSTGAPAHIASAPRSLKKNAAAVDAGGTADLGAGPSAAGDATGATTDAATDAATGAPTDATSGPTAGARPGAHAATGIAARVSRVRVPSSISLARARQGLTASFVVPSGARVVDVRLLLGTRTVYRSVVPAGKAGTRQTARINSQALRRVLRGGRFTLALRAGTSRTQLGAPVLRTVRVR